MITSKNKQNLYTDLYDNNKEIKCHENLLNKNRKDSLIKTKSNNSILLSSKASVNIANKNRKNNSWIKKSNDSVSKTNKVYSQGFDESKENVIKQFFNNSNSSKTSNSEDLPKPLKNGKEAETVQRNKSENKIKNSNSTKQSKTSLKDFKAICKNSNWNANDNLKKSRNFLKKHGNLKENGSLKQNDGLKKNGSFPKTSSLKKIKSKSSSNTNNHQNEKAFKKLLCLQLAMQQTLRTVIKQTEKYFYEQKIENVQQINVKKRIRGGQSNFGAHNSQNDNVSESEEMCCPTPPRFKPCDLPVCMTAKNPKPVIIKTRKCCQIDTYDENYKNWEMMRVLISQISKYLDCLTETISQKPLGATLCPAAGATKYDQSKRFC